MHYVKYSASMNEVEFNAFKKKMASIFGEAITFKPRKTKKTFKNWHITIKSPSHWAELGNHASNFSIYGVKFRKQEDTIIFRMVFGESD